MLMASSILNCYVSSVIHVLKSRRVMGGVKTYTFATLIGLHQLGMPDSCITIQG